MKLIPNSHYHALGHVGSLNRLHQTEIMNKGIVQIGGPVN